MAEQQQQDSPDFIPAIPPQSNNSTATQADPDFIPPSPAQLATTPPFIPPHSSSPATESDPDFIPASSTAPSNPGAGWLTQIHDGISKLSLADFQKASRKALLYSMGPIGAIAGTAGVDPENYVEQTPDQGIDTSKGTAHTLWSGLNAPIAGTFHRKGAGPIEGETEDWITGQLNPLNIGLAVASMGESAVAGVLTKMGMGAASAAKYVRLAKLGGDLGFLSKFGWDVGSKAIPKFEQDWSDYNNEKDPAKKERIFQQMEREGTDLVLGSLSAGLATRGIDSAVHDISSNSPKGQALTQKDYANGIYEYQAENQVGSGQANQLHREGVKAVTDPLRREAISNNIEAAGDVRQLQQWEAAADDEHKPGYEAAQNLTDKELSLKDRLTSILDAWKARLRAHNLLAPDGGRENYIPHRPVFEDTDPDTGEQINYTGADGERDFLKKRLYDSHANGEQAGVEYKTKDAVKLTADYVERANNMIARDNLAEGLAKGQMNEGSPMAVSGGYLGVPRDVELTPLEAKLLQQRGQLQPLLAKGRVYEVTGPEADQIRAKQAVQGPSVQEPQPSTPAQAPKTPDFIPHTPTQLPAPKIEPPTTPLPKGAENFSTEGFKPGETTADHYANDPQRQALRNTIKEELLSQAKPVPEGQQPVAYVTGGGTASGKSHLVRELRLDDNAVNIDTDKVKTRLPEYREWKETDNANASKRVHKEASGISKDVLNDAIAQRKNIVIDSTTSGADDLQKIQNLKDKGYKVELHFVDIPTDLAIERERFRAENSPFEENRGRKTPRENIEATHKGAAEAFFKLKDIADEAHVYDNSRLNQDATPIYDRVGKSPENVYNKDRFDEYTNKANGQETRLTDSDSPRVRAIQSLLEEEVRLRASSARNSGIRPRLDSATPEQGRNGANVPQSDAGNGLTRRPNWTQAPKEAAGRRVIPNQQPVYKWKFSDYRDSGLRANRPLADQPSVGSAIVPHPDLNSYPGEAIIAQGQGGIPTDPQTGKRMMRVPVFVNPEVAEHLRGVLDTSAPKSALLRGALKVSGAAKSLLLSLSPFHWLTEGIRSGEAGLNPSKAFKNAVSMPTPVDYNNLTDAQMKAINDGLVVANTRPGHSGYLEEGNAPGHESFASRLPIIGNVNRWLESRLFGPQGFITGLKFDLYDQLKPKIMQANPGMTEEAAGRIAASQANNKFGGLNYTVMGRSASTQNAMRAMLLAPDFLESTGRSVLDVAGKYGMPLAKSLIAFNLLHYLTARAMNYLVNGSFHPEEGLNVQSKDGKKDYSLRTTLGDFLHFAEAPRDFIMNRVNPLLVRTPMELLGGVDQQGNKVSNTQKMWDTVRQVVPIPAQAITPKQQISQPSSGDEILKGMGVQSRKKFTPAETLAYQRATTKQQGQPLEGDALLNAQNKFRLAEDLREATENKDAAGRAKAIQNIIAATKGENAIIPYAEATQMINDASVNQTRLASTVHRLSLEDSLDVYESASLSEKRQIRNEVSQKIASWYKSLEQGKKPAGQYRQLQPRVQKFFQDKP